MKKWLALAFAVTLLLCLGAAGTVLQAVRPAPEAADLAQRPPPERPVAEPARPCRAELEVTRLDGSPIVHVEVGPGLVSLGADGVALLAIPCDGSGRARVRAEGFTPAYPERLTDGERRRVELEASGVLRGRVRTAQGEPIEGAWVHCGGDHGRTNEDGLFFLANPGGRVVVTANAYGFNSQEQWVIVPEGTDHELDFVLARTHRVRVFCAGMQDDACTAVNPLICTSPLLPFGERCFDGECPCPEGPAAVRGGGRRVAVAENENEVWLDFREGGGLRLRLLLDGEPLGAEALALRRPSGPEDLGGGGLAALESRTDAEGWLELEGMKAGRWGLIVDGGSYSGELGPYSIQAGEVLDLGTLELGSAGEIRGRVLDGVTGTPKTHTPVFASTAAGGGLFADRVTQSGDDGRFILDNLPAGEWEVYLPQRPLERVVVQVDGGEPPVVLLETGEGGLMEEQGFVLESAGEGYLVADVEEGGGADLAGLRPGDLVVGVRVWGLDPSGLGSTGDALQVVLEHLESGVNLVVEREGEELIIEL